MDHLDYQVLTTLKEVMEGDFPLLIETFIQDSSERIVKLHGIIATQDGDAIRRAAHSFKGSSGNVGALHLTALCAELENKALAGNLADLADDVAAIDQEFNRVQVLLQQWAE